MRLVMKPSEQILLESVLRCCRRYVEFGSGGSTVLAASLVKESVISVDSAVAWLDRVREACVEKECPIVPTLLHADIGPLKEWGFPADASRKSTWPSYHSDIWKHPESTGADFYLVDGRFRVACFMQVLLHGSSEALIGIHDFAARKYYHVIHEAAREIARAESLSIFVRRTNIDQGQISRILDKYAMDPQ
jgi:hypothetical protein